MDFSELGVTVSNPWKTTAIAVVLTLLLCVIQIASLRRILRLPPSERGTVFNITERIMPRSSTEFLVFVALACTAGLSEEFLYRGFAFAVFARMFANSGWPLGIAIITSSLWFGAAHLYQGRRGVITTTVVGVIFCGARVATGSLFPPIVAHVGVDLIAGIYVSRLRHPALDMNIAP